MDRRWQYFTIQNFLLEQQVKDLEDRIRALEPPPTADSLIARLEKNTQDCIDLVNRMCPPEIEYEKDSKGRYVDGQPNPIPQWWVTWWGGQK